MIYRNELPRALTRRYEISGVLGHGAFGTVFAGRDPRLDRHVAIKVVRADIDSFVREARALALLSHPHIVSIYDFDHDRGYCWFAMEKLSGGTLRSRLPGISAQAACAVALAQAAALEHAHRSQVLHRDIKPDNTLFDEAGRSVPKVADLGLAKVFDGSATAASRVAGTPGYWAPEQVNRGRLSAATDVYAIGACLCEGLFGTLPNGVAPPPIVTVLPRVSEVVRCAVDVDASRRFPRAHEFALALAAAAAADLGPRWIGESKVKLYLDDEIREASRRAIDDP